MRKLPKPSNKTPKFSPKFSLFTLLVLLSVAALTVFVWLSDGLTPRDSVAGGADPALRQYIIQYSR
ncbi:MULTISPECIES: hypothetical protein [Cupriavidus]|uniref:hypothetical protein n=1 Tax=Cupriavidus TaxID=106589 RepID=UPI00029136AF|nr:MULTISPECIES: hypothetical protein [Cupriavidus]ESJ23033.1 transmembrane protein [Cupriavidus sp. HPC(L)]MCD9123742.1 hypothetical protein [Cupriavidus sp. UGS-1]